MNKEQWMLWQARLKSHTAILVMVFLIGFLLTLYLFVYVAMPTLNESKALQSSIVSLEEQKTKAEQLTGSKKVSDEVVMDLVKQVPVKTELPRLLLALKDLEKRTKVKIGSITFQDGNKVFANPAATVNNGTESAAKTDSGNAQQALLVKVPFTIEVSGTYPEVINFVKGIQQTDRFLDIKKWSLQAGAAQDQKAGTTAQSSTASSEPRVQLSIIIDSYYTPSLLGKLKDLPPIPVTKPESRSNPTLSDDEFNKLLQQLHDKEQ
jgi:Tfp pilus assembly protein PilO